jgi:hypothetical protein
VNISGNLKLLVILLCKILPLCTRVGRAMCVGLENVYEVFLQGK